MTESARLVRMIGTLAPSTMPAASAPARNDRLFASMLPASRSGTTSTFARPATGETMCLIAADSSLIALSSASGPSRMPPVIWPRSAILHKAAASIVEGTLGLTVSIADRIATRTSCEPQRMRQIDRVLHDIDLVGEARGDVDRGVGDDQRVLVAGNIHHKAMADAARRADAGLARDNGAHQLVGMEAALHQGLGLALAHELDGLCRRSRGCAPRPSRVNAEMSTSASAAAARMRSGGPTRIGAIKPSLAASTRPRSRPGRTDGQRRSSPAAARWAAASSRS